jgi:hypothetical protein
LLFAISFYRKTKNAGSSGNLDWDVIPLGAEEVHREGPVYLKYFLKYGRQIKKSDKG